MNILKIQEAFQQAGFQWAEQVFNDDSPRNCFINFTTDNNPQALTTYPRPRDCVGWGRYARHIAWRMAYEWLCEWLKDGGIRQRIRYTFYDKEYLFFGTEQQYQDNIANHSDVKRLP